MAQKILNSSLAFAFRLVALVWLGGFAASPWSDRVMATTSESCMTCLALLQVIVRCGTMRLRCRLGQWDLGPASGVYGRAQADDPRDRSEQRARKAHTYANQPQDS